MSALDHSTRSPLHDPELPILSELEAELERELRALLPPARASRDRRLRQPARVTRRALVLVALFSLVGASALAGRAVFAPSPEPSTAPALLSAGGHPPEQWRLEAYLHGGSTCYALFVADTVSSACGAPPGRVGVLVTSAVSPTQRFVAGLAGADVHQVRVRVGRQTLTVLTRRPPQAAGARRAQLPAHLRWFLAILPGNTPARNAPARVTPRDEAGHPLGPPVLDCSLGAASIACQRAASRIAGPSGSSQD
jgi:hypothetical protein